ncbi:putative phenylalanine--tRNA ligase beta subunit, partial [Dictyocoela roeselum]
KIRFPVYYRNVDNFKFAPLNTDYEIEDLKQHFGKDKKFRRYVEMISHYSVFTDSDANILSVPPVINSEYSRLTRNTKNVFIEITSHDLSRAIQALNYILYTFRGESVTYLEIVSNINGVNGIKSTVGRTIKDQVNKFFFTLDEINKELGLDLSPDKVSKYLERMMHKVEILSEDKIAVTVYGVRGDVLHKCDLIEDIAIAHGYNNFEFVPINISTIGSEDSLNKFSNKIRNELAMCGYIEVLLFTLVSARDLNFGTQENVALENPKSVEYGFVRNELISSLLKCVHANQHVSLPIKIFEVGDVVVLESRSGDKDKHDFTSTAVNKRKAGAMIAAKKDAFEEIQGLVTQIFKKCNLVVSYVETTRRGFVEKRCGQIVCEGEELGHFGIVELNVCRKMGVPLVCTAFEIDLRGLFRLFLNKN